MSILISKALEVVNVIKGNLTLETIAFVYTKFYRIVNLVILT
jgi:hypothetical protein